MSAQPSTGPCPLRGVTEDRTGVWVHIHPGSGGPGSKVSTLSTPGHASARKNLRTGLGSGAWGRRGTGTVGGGKGWGRVGNRRGARPRCCPPVAAKSTAPGPAAAQTRGLSPRRGVRSLAAV